MLKKLMSIAVIGMMMVGCGNTTQPTQPTKNVDEQPKQVIIQQQEENTPQDVQEPVKDNKEQPKEEVKQQPKKEELPAGAVKDGTHLQEEADKQDRQIIEENKFDVCPECGQEPCICDGDTDEDITYPSENNNLETPIYHHEDVIPDEFMQDEE